MGRLALIIVCVSVCFVQTVFGRVYAATSTTQATSGLSIQENDDCYCPCRTESQACSSPDGNCYKVNVAAGKAASMSARYVERGWTSGPPKLAVDGDISTDSDKCVHTQGSMDSQPDWWQVDLGRNYTVTDITIYHREGGVSPYPHNQRISGVWIYVDDVLCYKFPNSRDIGYQRKQRDDVKCQQPLTGRVVRFSKDGVIHAKHFSFINFCEVQIWVCKSGRYGPKCQEQCHQRCQDALCDNYDGTCLMGCGEGYHGENCSAECGQCRDMDSCDPVTGHCPQGCQPGYRPPDCLVTTTTTTTSTTTTTTTTTPETTSTATTESTFLPSKTFLTTTTMPQLITKKADQDVVYPNIIINSSSNSYGQGCPCRQRSVGDNTNSNDSMKYTNGELAGVSVAMVLFGAILGVICVTLYNRLRMRRGGHGGIAFTVMDSDSADVNLS